MLLMTYGGSSVSKGTAAGSFPTQSRGASTWAPTRAAMKSRTASLSLITAYTGLRSNSLRHCIFSVKRRGRSNRGLRPLCAFA